MRDVLSELLERWRQGETVGLGTVVQTWQSAPRTAGAAMFVTADGQVRGSVSGGCVEGAVHDLATAVITDLTPVLQRYGVANEDAVAVGLTCGGTLDVFVEAINDRTLPQLQDIADDIAAGRPVALATVIEHPSAALVGRHLAVRPDDDGRPAGTLGLPRVDDAVIDDARGLLAAGRSETLTYGPNGERRGDGLRVFVSSYAPKPRMLVFGATDFAAALAQVGSLLQYDVTVCDARPVFATTRRFPGADHVVVEWPHRYLAAEQAAGRINARTVVCVLTHDPKFDVPLLEVALRLPEVAYVGAMGSRRTHDQRTAKLRHAGVTDDELARLSSPIGLDLGARTPEETAISIAAEMVAMQWGGRGGRLSIRAGAIHHDDNGERVLRARDTPHEVSHLVNSVELNF